MTEIFAKKTGTCVQSYFHEIASRSDWTHHNPRLTNIMCWTPRNSNLKSFLLWLKLILTLTWDCLQAPTWHRRGPFWLSFLKKLGFSCGLNIGKRVKPWRIIILNYNDLKIPNKDISAIYVKIYINNIMQIVSLILGISLRKIMQSEMYNFKFKNGK